MWKYILIVAFLLFTIREINLINQSLYVEPNTNQIIVEDKTILSKVLRAVTVLKTELSPYRRAGMTTVIQTHENESPEPTDENNTKIEPLYANTLANIPAKDNQSLSSADSSKPEEIVIKPIAEINISKIQKPAKMENSRVVESISYPEGFESAQERVNAILKEMKQH